MLEKTNDMLDKNTTKFDESQKKRFNILLILKKL